MLIRLVCGSAIFCSSLLLLLVQPMMAKSLLPWFGGTAGVWACAMLFFQAVLLLGYAYAHWSVERLGRRAAVGLHLSLLGASLLFLPVSVPAAWKPTAADDPAWRVLAILAASVGLPYFLLSTTGPLVQAWYADRTKTRFPYRLFALSNLASLAGLLAYSLAVEPLLATRLQFRCWSGAYLAFAALAGAAACLGAGSAKRVSPKPPPPRLTSRLLWLALAVCPAVLWMGLANTLSQSVAPVPFVWVLPFSIYLLTLVLSFGWEAAYYPRFYRFGLPAAWLITAYCLTGQGTRIGLRASVCLLSAALFVCCLYCHAELARRKPVAENLTSFYLMVALGGVAGGVFVAVAASRLFNQYLELPIAVAGCAVLSLGLLYGYPVRHLPRLALVAVAGFFVAVELGGYAEGTHLRVRNFYGTLHVNDTSLRGAALRTLANGPTRHGSEFLSPERRRNPTTYYGPESGAALAIRSFRDPGERVAVVGLGAGTLAAYGRPGDLYRFYEINPAVIEVARTQFHFLGDCPAAVEVLAGDGRLLLERERGQSYDVLVLDAFTGGAIPTHLLTREAFALYEARLKPGGVLAVHATNRYLDLISEVRALAGDSGRHARLIVNTADPERDIESAAWVLVTANATVLRDLSSVAAPFPSRPRPAVWTDDYSNLFQALW